MTSYLRFGARIFGESRSFPVGNKYGEASISESDVNGPIVKLRDA